MDSQTTQTKQITKLRDLTFKQRKWLEAYIETGNATEAAARVYDVKDRNSAGQIGWENLKKLENSELMESLGLTKVNLVKILAVGLTKATKQINDKEVPDYATRHKYLETALKLNKMMETKVEEDDGSEVSFFFGDVNIQNNYIEAKNEAQNAPVTADNLVDDLTVISSPLDNNPNP